MAQSHTAPARSTARPLRRPATRPAPLEVVRPDGRARTIGAMGTLVVLLVFITLFAVAGLHAVLAQTQAQIDAIHAENSASEVERDRLKAAQASLDSPEGLEELAMGAGLVLATDVVMLSPIPAGTLSAPESADPFAGGSG